MGVGYREMAEASVSQAAYRRLEAPEWRCEADVRRTFWWRVRGLQRAGRLLPLAGVLALDGLAVVASLERPDRIPFWVFLLPLVTLCWAGVVAVSSRRAWRMARVARTEPGPGMPYLLLHSYASGAPWLVFFREEDGMHAEPAGALPLSYGPDRDLYRDLPAPVGEARLSGTLRSGAVVVPWIGDRVAWPAGGYRELDLTDPRQARSMTELVRPE
ncbi:hypothetical protein ACGFR6_08130 [Streptomyces sp. NPDC048567]|uniref:hypothetical protein n=1 Tax=Streptomyces sp. NPDC048567 TaxID=3365570 RepID=UPI003716752C